MSIRIIAKLDVKPPFLVKPVHFEGLRKIGTPKKYAQKYYEEGADEIFYIDIVASLYQREILHSQIQECAENVYIPFAVGGGVRSIEDISKLIHLGADKVVINTYALQEKPSIIDEAVKIFGSQAITVNVEAKTVIKGKSWECLSDCGRMRSDKDVLTWVDEVESRGAGEILLQSVDMDGRQRGFDKELISNVCNKVKIPVVAASGAGSLLDILEVAQECKPTGIALASLLHYNKFNITDVKNYLRENGVEVSR